MMATSYLVASSMRCSRARRTPLLLERPARYEIQQPQGGAVRVADGGRRRLAIHHARWIVGVIEPECMADLVANDSAHGAEGEGTARAVVIGHGDVRLRDLELARVNALRNSDALPF